MFTHILVWSTVIVLIAGMLWAGYWFLLAPFGPSSRCQENTTIISDGKVLARLMFVDHSMVMPMVRSHLGMHKHRVANKSDMEMLAGDPWLRTQLPSNARLLGEHKNGEVTELWAIDTSDRYAADIQFTRLHKIDTPSSMEDCLIVAMPCT